MLLAEGLVDIVEPSLTYVEVFADSLFAFGSAGLLTLLIVLMLSSARQTSTNDLSIDSRLDSSRDLENDQRALVLFGILQELQRQSGGRVTGLELTGTDYQSSDEQQSLNHLEDAIRRALAARG